MKNKKVIMLIILVVIAILSLSNGFLKLSKGNYRPATGETVININSEIPKGEIAVAPPRKFKRTSFTSSERNPLLPTLKNKGLVLNGILYEKENSKAIINNEIVVVGDKINGNKVIEIKNDAVILNDGIKNFELKLE